MTEYVENNMKKYVENKKEHPYYVYSWTSPV